jgi:hypothetical protein
MTDNKQHNMINEEKDKFLEISVHPHIISGVSKNVDRDGNNHIIVSDVVNMYQAEKETKQNGDFTARELIDNIYHLISAIGMFSSRFATRDEFTKINYQDNQDDLCFYMLKGACTYDMVYPHDRIQFHKDNEWLFHCYQTQYLTEKRMILHQDSNFPSVMNIRRSSGAVQKGIIKSNEGFVVRPKKNKTGVESKTPEKDDIEYQVRVRVHFSITDPDCTDPIYCDYNKFVYLEDLVELNPEFTGITIKKDLSDLDDIDTTDPTKEEVVEIIRNNYNTWFNRDMYQALKSIPNFTVSYLS